jgi:hypothetical protein
VFLGLYALLEDSLSLRATSVVVILCERIELVAMLSLKWLTTWLDTYLCWSLMFPGGQFSELAVVAPPLYSLLVTLSFLTFLMFLFLPLALASSLISSVS